MKTVYIIKTHTKIVRVFKMFKDALEHTKKLSAKDKSIQYYIEEWKIS